MLDAQTIATVKATIPLLVETGPKLTAHFYDRMFTHNPELKEIFNMVTSVMAINVKPCLTLLPPTPVILKTCLRCCQR